MIFFDGLTNLSIIHVVNKFQVQKVHKFSVVRQVIRFQNIGNPLAAQDTVTYKAGSTSEKKYFYFPSSLATFTRQLNA